MVQRAEIIAKWQSSETIGFGLKRMENKRYMFLLQ
jgi:hypothetical protein